MSRIANRSQLLAAMGVAKWEDLENPNSYGQMIALSIPSTATANTFGAQIEIPGNVGFVIDELIGDIWLDAALNSAIVGTPLNRDPSPTAASNTHVSTSLVTIKAAMGRQSLPERGTEMAFHLVFGTASAPRVLMQQLFVPPKGTLRIDGTNNSGGTIKGMVIFSGRYIRQN